MSKKKPVCFTLTEEANAMLDSIVKHNGPDIHVNRSTTLERLIRAEYEAVVAPTLRPNVVNAALCPAPVRQPKPTPETCVSFDYAFEQMLLLDRSLQNQHAACVETLAKRAAWVACVERLASGRSFLPADN